MVLHPKYRPLEFLTEAPEEEEEAPTKAKSSSKRVKMRPGKARAAKKGGRKMRAASRKRNRM